MLFSLTGYLGVNCVMVLLKCSGALTTVTGMDHVIIDVDHVIIGSAVICFIFVLNNLCEIIYKYDCSIRLS